MTFFAQAWELISWIAGVLARLFRVRPGTTTAIVLNRILHRMSQMLAAVLPLKVILLAGAQDIPSYFRPFVGPEHKTLAVGILLGLAIGFYLLTFVLDTLGKRMAERGGDGLMAQSVGMAIVSNQREQMRDYYSQATSVAAAALFAVVAFGLLLYEQHLLALTTLSFILVALGVTAVALRPRADHSRSWFATFILDNTGSYLSLLSTLAFLSGLLAILYPLFMGYQANILRSILVIFLFRQTINALVGMVRDMRSLNTERHMVDTLIFPEHRLREVSEVIHGTLQELFAKPRRETQFRQEFPLLAPEGSALDIEWQDPVLRDANKFMVASRPANSDTTRFFESHVYTLRINKPIENEALLFRHISRDDVFAPEVVGRYSYGPFDCIVYDGGIGKAPPMSAWAGIKQTVFMRLVGLQPPKALADAYNSTHFLLGERLRDEMVDRMEIAVEGQPDRERLDALRACLPRIRQELAHVPLCIANPDFKPNNLTERADGGFQVMSWGLWLLEPIGARFDMGWKDEVMETYLAHARRQRSDIPNAFSVRHVRLMDEWLKLERRLKGSSYRNALNGIDPLVASLSAITEPQVLKLSA